MFFIPSGRIIQVETSWICFRISGTVEKLGNRVLGLLVDAILNCFISDLIPDIRNELAIQKLVSISQAIGLEKLIEAKLKDSKPKPQRSFPFSPQTTFNKTFPNLTKTPPTSTTTTASTSRPPPPQTPTKLPIHRLTAAQLQERRALGLCYNCDEKFIAGHKCSSCRFLLLLIEDEVPSLEDEQQPPGEDELLEVDNPETYFQLSLHAVSGQFSPQTLKFKGFIQGLPVIVLIDTGSTHNILQPRITNHLQLLTTAIS